MRIAEYKQIRTKTEEYTVIIPAEYDEEGNITVEEHEETHTREVPVMGMVYRDMTAEEIAEMEKIQAEMPEPQPTAEERLDKVEQRTDTLESATDDLVLMMAEKTNMKTLSTLKLKIMVRAFRIRIKNGEVFDDIAADYPALTTDDLEAIREALNLG